MDYSPCYTLIAWLRLFFFETVKTALRNGEWLSVEGIEMSFYSWLSLTWVAGRKTRIETGPAKESSPPPKELDNMARIFTWICAVLTSMQCSRGALGNIYCNNIDMVHFTLFWNMGKRIQTWVSLPLRPFLRLHNCVLFACDVHWLQI